MSSGGFCYLQCSTFRLEYGVSQQAEFYCGLSDMIQTTDKWKQNLSGHYDAFK
jgi:hypothetical protein